ncbi:NAD(P)-binding protein [Mycena kentingensis (nom. inval.)]|nr:NAD(P)-binding protein [Mycena kentingensis (nom. inval.)]
MSPTRNARLLFNSVPDGYPVPGETTVYDETPQIDLDAVTLNGGFLVKTLVVSIDPFIRGRLRAPVKKSYVSAFELGKPITSYGIGVVLRSENADVPVGRYVYGPTIGARPSLFCAYQLTIGAKFQVFEEYTVYPELGQLTFIDKHPDVPLSVYLGAAGMPGQTAYTGWKEHSEAKHRDVAFITTGAGSVGSFVIQLAKQAGCKVIASAGSDDKVNFMKSIGADVAFNYKTTDTREVLEREGPVDIFWDNVGGEILDAALEFAADNGRFILLSKYWKQFYKEVPAKLASGEIKYVEDITKGLDKAGDVILAVQKGTNHGKAVVIVAED